MSARIPEQIFVSYSRKDQEWLERLRVQLAPLVHAGTVKLWCDTGEIEPGDAFNRSITEAIDTSSAAVLLVSGDFQASEFIQANELPRLLRQADAGELRLFWVPVGHCVLADKLGETYHTVGNPSRPLEGCDRAEVNRVLTELARKLEQHVRELRQREEAARLAAAKASAAEEQRKMAAERERLAREEAERQQRVAFEAAARAAEERERERQAQAERERLAREETQRRQREAQAAKAREESERKRLAAEQAQRQPREARQPARWRGWGWKLAALLVVGFAVAKGRDWLRDQEPALPAPTAAQLEQAALDQVKREREMVAKREAAVATPAASLQPPALPPVPASPSVKPTPAPVPVAKPAPFTNSLGMKFVPVPGTDILMSVWETRVQDYAAYAAANPGVDAEWQDASCKEHKQEPNHPVVNVSWEDAQGFCKWLSQKEAKTYRLPTDHEWSLAVGIGDREDPKASPEDKDVKLDKVYPWGSEWPPPPGAGNYSSMYGYSDPHPFTAPVGSYSANKLGIFDLGGNAYEWCEDFYDGKSVSRVLRGASWNVNNPDLLLSSFRVGGTPAYRDEHYGFRVVLVGSGER